MAGREIVASDLLVSLGMNRTKVTTTFKLHIQNP